MKIASDFRHDRFDARVLLLSILTLLWQGPVLGGELYLKDPFSPTAYGDMAIQPSYHQCSARAEAVHPEVMSCIYIELDYQDLRLNRVYRELKWSLSKEQWDRLRSEQRRWLAGLERYCRSGIHEDITGGQAEEMELGSCTLYQTAARAKVLEDLLKANTGSPE